MAPRAPGRAAFAADRRSLPSLQLLVDGLQDALDEVLAIRALPVNLQRCDALHLEPDQRVDEVAQLAVALLDKRLVLQALQARLR